MAKEKLYDVVVYETATGLIESVVGENMRRNTGFYNAEKRAETLWSRINEHYAVKIVPAGKFKKGDKLK